MREKLRFCKRMRPRLASEALIGDEAERMDEADGPIS